MVLNDFLTDNSHKYYPFAPTNGVNTVPTALLLDMHIIATSNVPDNSGSSSLYISKIVTDGTQIRFYFAINAGTTYDLGCLAVVPVSNEIPVRTPFKYVGNNMILEGFLITGDTNVATQMPSVTTLTASQGRIYTGCISHMTHWLAGISVNDELLSGVVTLEAGAGVSFSVDTTNKKIIISCTGAEIPPANQIIVDDTTLLQEITNTYGVPITTINGYPANNGTNQGNWNIAVNSDDGLAIDADPGTASITISNLLAAACCSQDDITVLVDNIGTLNERAGILNSFLSQLENNMNTLSAQLARLS